MNEETVSEDLGTGAATPPEAAAAETKPIRKKRASSKMMLIRADGDVLTAVGNSGTVCGAELLAKNQPDGDYMVVCIRRVIKIETKTVEPVRTVRRGRS